MRLTKVFINEEVINTKLSDRVSIGIVYGLEKDEVLPADFTCDSINEVEEIIYKINLEERVKLCVE